MDTETPMDIIYEICLRSLEVYRAAIYSRKFHEYMGVGRLLKLQHAHTVRDGTTYTLCGRFHRVDGPAKVDRGTEWWYRYGQYHREDGPAITTADGDEHWYLNGKRHRVDGPAITYKNRSEYWYQNGKLHRVGGPAEIRHNGTKRWYLNGELHRHGGPAVISVDGDKQWYLNGVRILPGY